MKRKKGDLLLSWQKKPVGIYLGDYSYYSFKDSIVCFYGQAYSRKKAFKALFYTENGLRGAHLRGAHLAGANLIDAHLRGVHLRDADLREADLTFANLRETDLTFADLREADLTNIKYDENTVWPEGFKPPERW